MRNYVSEYFGATGTSTENIELIQQWKTSSNGPNLNAGFFDFIPGSDCTVIVNGSAAIPFKANKEFLVNVGENKVHQPIWQFQIVEADISYWYMGIFM